MSEPVWVPLGAATVLARRYPIALNTPRQTTLGGNSFWTAAAAGAWDMGRWEFVRDVEGRAYGFVAVPPSLGPAPNAKIILAIAANAVAGVTRLQVAERAFADGEALVPEAGTSTEAAQDVVVPATANVRKDVTFTLTEPLAAGDILFVEVIHLGAHANDTLAANTLLLGAWLEVVA